MHDDSYIISEFDSNGAVEQHLAVYFATVRKPDAADSTCNVYEMLRCTDDKTRREFAEFLKFHDECGIVLNIPSHKYIDGKEVSFDFEVKGYGACYDLDTPCATFRGKGCYIGYKSKCNLTMTANRIHTTDNVLVEIYLDGKRVDTFEGSGFHNVEQAIETAYDGSERVNKNIEDYVFRVSDIAGRTSARYRVNAGGNIKLIPEE